MMRRAATAPAAGAWMRPIAFVMTAVVAVTTLAACVPENTARSESRELRLYEGPIPEPAPLTPNAMGELVMPEPPSDFNDEAAMEQFQKDAQAYAEAMQNTSGDAIAFATQVGELVEHTRHSDEASVAAWQSLLVAADIAVGRGDDAVEVNGMRGAGIPLTEGELRLHALLGASEGSLPLTGLAAMLHASEVFPQTEDEFTQQLYDALMAAGGSNFGIIFNSLNIETFVQFRYGQAVSVPLEEVILSGAQVALVLRKLSVELLDHVEANGGIEETFASLASTSAPLVVVPATLRTTVENPCGGTEDPFDVEARKQAGNAAGALFGEILDKIPGFNGAKLAAALAHASVAVASLITQMFTLQADFSMANSPLVRTKNREAGEKREIVVTLSYPERAFDDARRCLSALFSAVGFSLSDHDKASGVDVDLVMRNDRLWFSTERGGTATFRQKADDEGRVSFPVLGKPQRERLPEGAEPDEVTARVRAEANVQGSDLAKDLIGAGWDAIGRSAVGIIANILARMQLVVFAWEVPVRDWELVADFDVTLTGTLWGHSAINQGGNSECGTWIMHGSTSAEGSVESQQPVRVTAHYVTEHVDGQPVSGLVMYPKGSNLDAIRITDDGGELVHLPLDYAVTKSESAPGQDPMPPHYVDPVVGGCGDGEPGSGPPTSDCGARDYMGLGTVVVNDGSVRILADEPIGTDPWTNCGWRLAFADPLAPPTTMTSCDSAVPSGGQVPSADSVFNTSHRFEITGSLSCSRDGQGTLQRFTFDWTLNFCRVEEGQVQRAEC